MHITKQTSPAERRDEDNRRAEIEKTAARLEYLAIMTGVEIPDDKEEVHVEER